jgi:PBP1b-binding outer membrane lipoprotein LpoB
MKIFYKIAILTILLSGCAKTPTESVIDNHMQHIDDVLDYSYNNIDQTKDVVFLQNELKSCKTALEDIKQTYKGEISTCNAKTNYWRLATAGLVFALCALIFLWLKGIGHRRLFG